MTGSARSRLARSCNLTRHIFRGTMLFVVPIASDMNRADYLLTQRKLERYYKTSVSRERVASLLLLS